MIRVLSSRKVTDTRHEYVVVHSRMSDRPGARGTAVVDIWKFDAGLITGHWDVKQPVPEDEEIPNGMF